MTPFREDGGAVFSEQLYHESVSRRRNVSLRNIHVPTFTMRDVRRCPERPVWGPDVEEPALREAHVVGVEDAPGRRQNLGAMQFSTSEGPSRVRRLPHAGPVREAAGRGEAAGCGSDVGCTVIPVHGEGGREGERARARQRLLSGRRISDPWLEPMVPNFAITTVRT